MIEWVEVNGTTVRLEHVLRVEPRSIHPVGGEPEKWLPTVVLSGADDDHWMPGIALVDAPFLTVEEARAVCRAWVQANLPRAVSA